MHPALFIATRSTRRRAAVAATIAVVAAAGGALADSQASASTPSPASSSALLSPHTIGIGAAGTIVGPGHFGWQRHCPVNGRRSR
jgi:hypothetical protein